MEKKLEVARKSFTERTEAHIEIIGLSKRLRVSETRLNNLGFEKTQLIEKGTELQKLVESITEELNKEKTSVGDLQIKLTELEDLLTKNQREHKESLRVKQSE